MFSDKRSLQSQSVKAHILRPSEAQTAASEPDLMPPSIDASSTPPLELVAPPIPLSASSRTPLLAADADALDDVPISRCHAVIHNADTGASALCKMRFNINASAAECLADLPLAPLPPSAVKRAGQSRKGRPPSTAPSSFEDFPSLFEDFPAPPAEVRSHSCATLCGLGKDRVKCCVVPSMVTGETRQCHAEHPPDFIAPALGHVGEGDVEEFEEFYCQEWERLGPVDREIRCAVLHCSLLIAHCS